MISERSAEEEPRSAVAVVRRYQAGDITIWLNGFDISRQQEHPATAATVGSFSGMSDVKAK